MQDIEPYYRWRDLYDASLDEGSPFFGREYNEFEFTNTIYNYYIHPQWDDIGSPTLYIKLLFADYEDGFAIIEMIGEWNDAINNDIMTLKRDIADELITQGITRFILIGENVLNFHASDDCYYEEWYDDLAEENGWVVMLNFRQHVRSEMTRSNIDSYFISGGEMDDFNWRIYKPLQLFEKLQKLISLRLN